MISKSKFSGWKVFVVLFCFVLVLSMNGFAQQPQKPNWDEYKFLIGEWIGEGTGAPGEATGSTIFYLTLGEQVLVRKNNAEYPAANGKPAVTHEDLIFFYKENGLTKAIYFDNEGHVIHYSVEFSPDSSRLLLTSNIIQRAPRFRFIYEKVGNNKLNVIFEMAPPGKPEEFKKYVEGVIKKKM